MPDADAPSPIQANASSAYEYEFDVPPSAIDVNGHVNNVEFVRWMQEAAVRHFESVGGAAALAALGAIWVVRTHRVEYLRPALPGERLRVRTWVADFRRVQSLRRYEFARSEGGAVLVKGETDWVLVDVATGRPKSIPQEMRALLPVRPDAS
jgi:acyl-CoA thioester hydrolase